MPIKRAEPQEPLYREDDDLPEGWVQASLRSLITDLESGSRPRGGVRSIAEGVASIGGEHLNGQGGFRWEGIKFVPRPFFKSMSRGHIQLGDVLVVKDGATTGKVSLVRSDFPHQPAVVNEHVFICRPSPSTDPAFLFRYLFSREGQSKILEHFRGAAQGGITQEFAEGTMIPVAPLLEQRRIVEQVEALLARVNAARARLASVPRLLKAFRQSVLSAACAGKHTEEWRTGETLFVSSVPGPEAPSLDDSDLPQLPESWKWDRFDSVLTELKNGISTKPAIGPPGLPILRISAVRPGRVLLEDHRFLTDADELVETYSLQNHDLLFTRYNGSLDLLGVCGMVRGLNQMVLLYPDKLMRVRVKPRSVLPDFVELFFQEAAARDRMTRASKSSAGQQGVSGKNVKEQPIALPPLPEQREIVRRVEALFALADAIEAKLAAAQNRADALTQAILAKAFRGELVPTEAALARAQGRTYESAAELLKRFLAKKVQGQQTKSGHPSRHRRSSRLHQSGGGS